jgi:hypothetical protein
MRLPWPPIDFVTDWQFASPLERVWEEIRVMDRWPEWWPFVVRVELLRQGDADDIGSVARITWKTALPTPSTFDSELIAIERFPKDGGPRLRRARWQGHLDLSRGRRHEARPLRLAGGDDEGLDEPACAHRAAGLFVESRQGDVGGFQD